MKKHVHLDFETRSELDVADVGGAAYAAHPSTEILCFAWRVGDGPIHQVKRDTIEEWDLFGCDIADTVDFDDALEELFELANDPDVVFIAHNAFFEQCIWKHIMVKRYGWPEITIIRWRCTAAKAATYALPRALNGACDALNLSVRKDMEGNRVMKKLAKPRRPSKANPDKYWEPSKAPDDFEILYAYNINDVAAESELDIVLLPLRPLEQEIWFMDQRMNHHGVKLDLPMIRRAIEFMERCEEDLLKEFRKATNNEVDRPSLRAQLIKWCADNGLNLPNTQAAEIDKLLARHKEQKHLPESVARALTISRQLGRTSTAKYRAMLERVSTDGRLKDLLLYYGAARTGRWAGRGVQPQNFVRPKCDVYEAVDDMMRYDYDFFAFLYPVMDTLAEIIRGAIIVDEGMLMYVADFAAIEARVNAWVSEEEELLQLFRDGDCNYCNLASSIYDKPINKKDHPDERQIGKVGELALGYEGGINAFATMANTYRLDLEPAYPHIWASATPEEREAATKAYNRYKHSYEEPVSREFGVAADIIKQRYRIARPNIKRNWRLTEEAAVEAVLTGLPTQASKCTFFVHGEKVRDPEITRYALEPAEPFMVDGVKYVRTSKGGCYKWDTYFLHIKLPSGRCLRYHQPELYDVRTPWGQTKKQMMYMGVDDKVRKGFYGRVDTYGGKLVENIVQAIARDLMAESFLRIEKAGYTPILQVHDEAISEAPADFGSVEEYEELMAALPAWAKGLPVKAEGWSGPRYKKG